MNRLALLVLMLIAPVSVLAHEMRPAYLSLHETSEGTFDVRWKVPAVGDQRLGLYVLLPETCSRTGEPVATIADSAYFEHWIAVCSGGLEGATIRIDGLTATLTDVLVRIAWVDGAVEIARLTPDAPSFAATGAQTTLEVAGTYFRLGVDHILSGFDHLLFVFALILLIRDRWMLLKTITAFTVAHSITLAGASLGYIRLPQAPVEAVIALSIAFVAAELVKTRPGEPRTSERYPWVVAFAFGLLHGFGFAGALKETGLPQTDVPVALLTFNLGVEAGQLVFVLAVLVIFRAARIIWTASLPAARSMAAYAIGTMAMFWLIDRLLGLASAA